MLIINTQLLILNNAAQIGVDSQQCVVDNINTQLLILNSAVQFLV